MRSIITIVQSKPPRLVATLVVNDQIIRAICSLCHEPIEYTEDGTNHERDQKLREAFRKHVAMFHSESD